MSKFFSLKDILSVANLHPFYNAAVEYPPDPITIRRILAAQDEEYQPDLSQVPLSHKTDLYSTIQALSTDASHQNTYRQSSTTSITGGGWGGGVPMLFVTDSTENRRSRKAIGRLIGELGIVEPHDWVLNIHHGGHLYRSLDLITDALEYAGATVLCAGSQLEHKMAIDICIKYQCGVLTGPVTDIVQLTRHIASLPTEVRNAIKIKTVFYTSEPMTRPQREYITSILGAVTISSGLGSAETGFWAVSHPKLTGEVEDGDGVEFIFDTRSMIVEIVSSTAIGTEKGTTACSADRVEPVADGTVGPIVLTSLQRLRNPLVRYVTGDMGSLHDLPVAALAKIPPKSAPYLRMLRLYGRDQRFSFNWNSNYFDLAGIQRLMGTDGWGIPQWQIILGPAVERVGEDFLEIHVLRENTQIPDKELVSQLCMGFLVSTNPLCRVVFVKSANDFERSPTGNKVMKIVDRRI